MTGTIDPDGFCTRCQLVADWCECGPPPGPVPAGPDPDPDPAPDPDPPAGPPGDGETAPLARFDLGALMASGVRPPVLLCGGLLYAGGLHTLTGPPDCGKTTFALWCATRLLAEGRAVAMFDEESGPELTAEKLISLGAAPGDITGLHYFPYPARTWTRGDVAALARTLTDLGPAMVIWDSSAAFLARAGLDENDALDVTRFWSNVLAPCARRVGAAVLVADHDPKNPNGSRYSRGSGAKLAVVDVAFKIRIIRPFSRSQGGLLALDVPKDRRGWLHRAHRIIVGHDPLALTIARASAEEQPGTRRSLSPAQEKLLDVIDDTPRTVRELTDRFAAKHGHGLRRETVSKALNGLLDAGLVDCVPTGKGKPNLWSRNGRSDP
jgi:hypothetical protein